MTWFIALQNNKVGTELESPNYAWPTSVLDFLRALIPDDIKGEIYENSYPVSLETLLVCTKISLKQK